MKWTKLSCALYHVVVFRLLDARAKVELGRCQVPSREARAKCEEPADMILKTGFWAEWGM